MAYCTVDDLTSDGLTGTTDQLQYLCDLATEIIEKLTGRAYIPTPTTINRAARLIAKYENDPTLKSQINFDSESLAEYRVQYHHSPLYGIPEIDNLLTLNMNQDIGVNLYGV